jgi:2'-5' RNA ligase
VHTALADHWYWRPGWGIGTRYLTWHLLWDDQPALHRHAAGYREALHQFGDALAVVPDQWLHLTMQGVGHSADVPASEVEALVAGATRRLTALGPPSLTFGAPRPHRETVGWTVEPAEGPGAVREALRDALVAVRGPALEPEYNPGRPFVPHVTLAYATRDLPAQPVAEALETVDADPVTVTVRWASLIELHRDHRQYEWTVVARVPIGGS